MRGHVENGWGKVADVFRANFEARPGEVGAACCVYVGGRPVVDLWGGLADREANRHAPFTMEEVTAGMLEATGLDADTVTAWMSAVWGAGSVQARAAEVGGAFTGSDYPGTRAFRAAEFPFGNMFTNARSLARMYAATVSDVDGVRLLNPATVETMTAVQTDRTRMHGLPPGLNVPADRSFYMSLGFWRACPPMPWVGPGSFGHPGSGGSVGFADPDAGVGFCYVPNLWSWNIAEPRAKNLAAAVVACLG